jgi:hypothetical protein
MRNDQYLIAQRAVDEHAAGQHPHSGTRVAGSYYAPGGVTGTGTTSLSTLRAAPILIPRRLTIVELSLECTVLAAAAGYRLGIYADAAAGQPGALILDAGLVTPDMTTTGLKVCTISQVLQPGRYWLAGVSQGTNDPTVRTLGVGAYHDPNIPLSAPLASAGSIGFAKGSVAGALPAQFTSASPTATAPRIFYKIG